MTPEPWLSRRFLGGLLAISIGTNALLLVRVGHPDLAARVRDFWNRPTAIASSDHRRGAKGDVPVVVEYADFECPFCAGFHSSMRKLAEEGRVTWIYRHYPLSDLHPAAVALAEASECAADQGQFWAWADMLYSVQERAAPKTVGSLAWASGLDTAAFRNCTSSRKHRQRIADAVQEGRRLRIDGTPTYFVNGRRFAGFESDSALRAVLASVAR